jgi:hypothetical protein
MYYRRRGSIFTVFIVAGAYWLYQHIVFFDPEFWSQFYKHDSVPATVINKEVVEVSRIMSKPLLQQFVPIPSQVQMGGMLGGSNASQDIMTLYVPVVEYSYTVRGREYRGSKLAYGENEFFDMQDCVLFLNSLGSIRSVYVQQDNPSKAVVLKAYYKSLSYPKKMELLTSTLVIISILVIAYFIFRPRRMVVYR